jgi:hypothetical protein
MAVLSVQGRQEEWSNEPLRALTLGKANEGKHLKRGLRIANRSGQYVHRHVRFAMSSDKAIKWRDELIAALRVAARRGRRLAPLQFVRFPAIGPRC